MISYFNSLKRKSESEQEGYKGFNAHVIFNFCSILSRFCWSADDAKSNVWAYETKPYACT